MVWKKAARKALHHMGGLAALRWLNRGKFQALMFHCFEDCDVPGLEALCRHIAEYFSPVSISDVSAALRGGNPLPDRAVTVTVDDAYRSFLLHGWPVLRQFHIPAVVYAVTEFSDGRIWLWPDLIEYGLTYTAKDFLDVNLAGTTMHLDLSSLAATRHSIGELTEALKTIPNHQRLEFLNGFGRECGVEMPDHPPADKAAMNWDELRAAHDEGMEIGCHSATHPILSQVADAAQLEREIAGARQFMEAKLGFQVTHFAYPNGQPQDINDSVVNCVRRAGFSTAVTTSWGLNSPGVDSLRLRRTPFDSKVELPYGSELLAGLHF